MNKFLYFYEPHTRRVEFITKAGSGGRSNGSGLNGVKRDEKKNNTQHDDVINRIFSPCVEKKDCYY